jgi:glycosyltransferase involved in cell wall biosynthesis
MTACECHGPGFCERHQIHKTDVLYRLCQTRPDYFAAWEASRNAPGGAPRAAPRPTLIDVIGSSLAGLRSDRYRTLNQVRTIVDRHCRRCELFSGSGCRALPGCSGPGEYRLLLMVGAGRCPRRLWEREAGDVAAATILHITPAPGWQSIVDRSLAATDRYTHREISRPTAQQLREALRDSQPAAVIVHAYTLPVERVGDLAADNPERQVIAVTHSSLNHMAMIPRLLSQHVAHLDLAADAPNVHYAASDIAAVVRRRGMYWWPNPVHLPPAVDPPPLATPRILVASRLDPTKALPAQIAAAAILQREHGAEVAIQIKPGPSMDWLRALACAYGLSADYWDWTDRQTWLDRLRESVSILLQPSLSESFNYLSVDAASVGRPFVGSPAIAHTPPAWQANPNDPWSIALTAQSILADYPSASHLARTLAVDVAARQNSTHRALLAHLVPEPHVAPDHTKPSHQR